MDVPEFMSWDDEGRDLTAWLGNDMQKDAIHALYALAPRVHKVGAPDLGTTLSACKRRIISVIFRQNGSPTSCPDQAQSLRQSV